jgi:threonine dehydrogenase-like Zn-dependent dehydrogenase
VWAYRLTAPRTFERIEVEAPVAAALRENQVLLRTVVGGLCGSDLPAFKGVRGRLPGDDGARAAEMIGFPLHEVVGEVVASAHPAIVQGERVVGWASGFDGLAEYVVADGEQLHTYGDLAPEVAIALQPLACVLFAVDQLPDPAGKRVAVIGQGPIGLLFSHVLASRGAAHVVGVDPIDRSKVAETFGVDETVTATSDRWSALLAEEARPQIVVEAVGHQVGTLAHATTAVANCGTVLYFGVNDDEIYPLNMRDMLRKSLTLLSGTARDRRAYLAAAVDYAAANPGLLESYVTDVYPISELTEAFSAAIAPKPEQLKIVLRMSS